MPDRAQSPAGDPALAVEGVSWAYSRRAKALDSVGFTVPIGSFTALLGPNGAGKTTLLSLITRLFASRTGTIRIAGHDLAREPRRALAAIGVVFQRPTLDLDLSVVQNLRYAAQLYGIGGIEAARRIDGALSRLELTERAADAVRTLSGGMRRRAELARSLLHAPRLLVLDEPTVGLDIDSRHAIVEHVHALCATDGLAALWATHLVDEIRPRDRVVVLAEGRVRAQGPVEAVLREAGAGDLVGAYHAWTGERAAA